MKNLKKLLAMATLLTVAFAADIGAGGGWFKRKRIQLRQETGHLWHGGAHFITINRVL